MITTEFAFKRHQDNYNFLWSGTRNQKYKKMERTADKRLSCTGEASGMQKPWNIRMRMDVGGGGRCEISVALGQVWNPLRPKMFAIKFGHRGNKTNYSIFCRSTSSGHWKNKNLLLVTSFGAHNKCGWEKEVKCKCLLQYRTPRPNIHFHKCRIIDR